MYTQIEMNKSARDKMMNGINKLADVVKSTLGPLGSNVVLERMTNVPTITNDGVTIAREMFFTDHFENMGAQMVKEAAINTNNQAGDGTTTATLLAQAILKEGLKQIDNGVSAIAIKRGIEKAVKKVVEAIKIQSKPIKTKEEYAKVATVSCGDSELGNLIAELMEKVGADGVIEVEESGTNGITSEIVNGLEIDRGVVAFQMITDRQRVEAVVDNPRVLLTDKKITSTADILPILTEMSKAGQRDLVIIAESFTNEVISFLIVNKMQGIFNTVAINAPSYGKDRLQVLEDIGALVGAEVLSQDKGQAFESLKLEMLGVAKKVVSNQNSTKIIALDGEEDKEMVKFRIAELKGQISKMGKGYDQDKLKERLAKLAGGVGIIRVGASSEIELKEKKFKIEDAVEATKAASEEGIVPGGGICLLNCQSVFDGPTEEGDEQIGEYIVRDCLAYPIKQIAVNAGINGEVVIEKINQYPRGTFGWNAATDEYNDMFEMGVIDPAKVVRCAIENSASVAGMILTTNSVVVEEPQKE